MRDCSIHCWYSPDDMTVTSSGLLSPTSSGATDDWRTMSHRLKNTPHTMSGHQATPHWAHDGVPWRGKILLQCLALSPSSAPSDGLHQLSVKRSYIIHGHVQKHSCCYMMFELSGLTPPHPGYGGKWGRTKHGFQKLPGSSVGGNQFNLIFRQHNTAMCNETTWVTWNSTTSAVTWGSCSGRTFR